MAQQTAMQKLFTNLENIDIKVPQGIKDIYLQVEKEQIEIAFSKSYLIGLAEVNYDDVNKAAEQYYNKTYKK